MAFDNNQQESALPIGSNNKKTSVDFLPKYFRTDANKKFLSATIDQMINEGTVGKVNAFIGRRDTPAFKSTDRYLEEVSSDRAAYQLEPAIVSKDTLDNVTFFKDYTDYINQLNFFAGNTLDHSKVNSEEYYAWNPNIDWDKFVNYREYYWLPAGPQPITVVGQSTSITSTYTVKLIDEVDNIAYLFSPDGLTANPTFKLYRGQTYNFEIDCEDRPFAFKTVRNIGSANLYTSGIVIKDADGVITASAQHVKKGTIEFTVPQNAPNLLYYVSETDINTSGYFTIFDITDSTEIDVDAEIIGKKDYTTSSNVALSNGMKLSFQGQITPEKYSTGNWYVEGVGTAITLISEKDLETPASYTAQLEIEFDNENFDTQGYDVNNNYPATKDYIVINRGSKDRNPWSRHNRWFHRSIIENSASANNQVPVIDQDSRAKRPIIEFAPNLYLWEFGKIAKQNVTVVDMFTTDVFSTIEGSYGYNVDKIDLVEGMRVLFAADTDTRVSGRIFTVHFITHLGESRITLLPTDDTDPQDGETVLITEGETYRGSMLHYMDGVWMLSQDKKTVNQAPLFEVVDPTGTSYGDTDKYQGTTFKGTKLFSYEQGTTYDTELGFNIAYRNVGNFGDIVFNFNLHTDSHSYQSSTNLIAPIDISLGYLRINNSLTSFSHANGWTIAAKDSLQYIVRQYSINQVRNMFLIDAYKDSGTLTDLQVKVYLNGRRQYTNAYKISIVRDNAYVEFFKDLSVDDSLVIKTKSSALKINGYYEFPFNLENNPQNLNLNTFTLGEINNHVSSIADNIDGFTGIIPGTDSLRDLGNITPFGTKVVQHSAPLLPIAYHITNKNYNVINALKTARLDYAKFKRNLIRKATDYGYDGIVRVHLDLILKEVTRDHTKIDPYYLSDMIPCSASFIFDQEIIDDSITEYPLTFDFDLTTSSERAVLVYVNEELLVHSRDYVFVNTNFVNITSTIASGDNLKIVQYEKTDGCYLPLTPTKLGMYPKFEPKIYIDTTYQVPTKVIQGHDGSITVAFDDYRDDLLLEFEKRIFNNIKQAYDITLFDIYDYLPGYNRNTDLSSTDIDSIMAADFLHWSTLIADDYTKHAFFDRTNPKTYNYKEFKSSTGTQLAGFWRGIFKQLYDTDRPHTHPWEMLGLSIKPQWWETVYGPSPYTRDNLILWNDLADGLIKEPGKNIIKKVKFVRPYLTAMIPVDETGNLLAPSDLGIIEGYTSSLIQGEFKFGDQAPIETAWRRSSEYPFALLTALTILKPANVFASCFDRVRQYRDDTGQLVYKVKNGNLRFNISNLAVPSTSDSSERVYTAGLVNYVVDYIIGKQSLSEVSVYSAELSNLVCRLASKLGGFTTKEKFKLILDSRNPLNSGNVFIPDENYNIILNTSSPVASIDYSGVIVEKVTTGFILRGYNKSLPFFKYIKPRITNYDAEINVGGVSASFSTWTANQYYTKDKIIFYNNQYFRVSTAHQASTSFEIKYFAKLPSLPLEGGRQIVIRTKFEDEVSTIHYGAEIKTIQGVVDFLLGYGEYLKSVGLLFENFNSAIRNITDFQTSAKEFAFWTTQNWSVGAVISLSPCAEEIKFRQSYSVVDNIYDKFYEYSILKQDGAALSALYTGNAREGNLFTLTPKNTSDGIYHATLNLVQKEHVLILDNSTIFNDVIYDQIQGYRQERIKSVGYRTTDWNGDFDIPGFVYDRAVVNLWKSWTDYNLGETVKYKEFYYSAKENVVGSENFNFNSWNKLTSRPTAKLIPNWDYRANQFADFYDLDTNSFDPDQQKFAQHLIGYQKRKYLENIINDDVSQYKFYQGFITEKGTENSFAKLFDALSTSTKESLEFYEEWAIRVGQYGANAGFDEVEFRLDETKFLINPQPIELTRSIDPNLLDFVYRILPNEVYLKSKNYNHTPFPTHTLSNYYVSTAGFVNPEDIEIQLNTLNEVESLNINNIIDGYYFWVAYDKNTWNVYRFTLFENLIREFNVQSNVIRITLDRLLDTDIKVDSYIGINNSIPTLEGFYKITNIGSDYFEFAKPADLNLGKPIELTMNLFKLVSVRMNSIEQINNLGIPKKKDGDLVWVDGTDNNWATWKYKNNYSLRSIENNKSHFGINLVVSNNNTILVVSIENSILYYTRPTDKSVWAYKDELSPVSTQDANNPNPTILLTNGSFGSALALKGDGAYLAVGVPTANASASVVGQTRSDGNRLILSLGTTANFILNGPVAFSNNTLSLIKVNTTYYIKSIINSTSFTISSTPGGDTFVLESRNGAMPVYANQGYVVLYAKNNNGYYAISNIIKSPTVTNNQHFGYKVAVIGDKVFVASKGSTTVAPSLSVYYISKLVAGSLLSNFNTNEAIDSTITFTLGTEILDMSVADNGNAVISFNNSTITVWNFSNTYQFNKLVQTLPNVLGEKSNFGSTISVSTNAHKLAVGAPTYFNTHINEGAVKIYYNVASTYTSWSVVLPGVTTSSTSSLTIEPGVKTLTVRRGGTGLLLNISTAFGVIKPNPVISSAGTGYKIDDIVFIKGGDGKATYKITQVNLSTGAIIAGVLLIKGTNYTANPATVTTPRPLDIIELQRVTITFDLANYMTGVVTSYDDSTATLVVNIKEAFTPGHYVPTELLTNPYNRGSEYFGSTVKFNTVSDQLVVASAGGRQTSQSTFDATKTTFDLEATTFLETEFGSGSVMLYDHYDNKFIFSDSLDVGDAVGYRYGSVIAMSNRIYISDYNVLNGAVHEFGSLTKSWYKFRTPSELVDNNKIKSAFLYDIEENSVITYIDIVDPLQGKILGIAEEELKFKTYYDPATYSYGNDQVVVDNLMHWKNKEIGQLWWDLSSAKFLDPNQGSVLYKANTTNTIFKDDLVDVYEWVESTYTPAEWDKLADTEVGLSLGISGKSKYGNTVYSTSKTYDTIGKTTNIVYYFWVKNKITVPDVVGRKISANDVAKYITNPKNMGVSYISFHGANQFSLVNCKNLIASRKVALNIRYWIIDNYDQANIHSHYQLLSTSDLDKPINKYVEQKWVDSLSGFDILGNEVPDPKLPVKLKYGILSRPRQSMFVNRVEALKQFIERVNSVLLTRSIIDDYDFTALNSKDEAPTLGSGKYDYAIGSYREIRFIGTNDIVKASLSPVIENGKIIRVNIVTSGKGYINPPEVVINGIGTGAKISTSLGSKGQIISAIVEKQGAGYLATTTLNIRTLSVLITADETANNRWALYSWNSSKKTWFRDRSQTYDTTRYWKYIDWYSAGYNEFTKLDYMLDFAYQLPSANIVIGDIVKVKNQGIGGWVLLEKIDNQDVIETTVNYKTVGRENGTIKFTDNLYKFAANASGFDGPTFDSYVFDDQPKTELKVILDTIKNVIFVDELAVEYKELFFASLRYAFSEQKSIDWAFKTSFIRSKHNLGLLEQKPTYQNDNLASYQDYINEAKPYRSKIREFVSTYEVYEPTSSQVSDFDLPPRYSKDENTVKTFSTKVSNGILEYDSSEITNYPYSDWLYNAGFNLVSIEVVDGGSGYTAPPQVIIEGAPDSISATAYLSSGTISAIVVNDPFKENFLATPNIIITGSIADTGSPARAVGILSNSLVRSTKVGIKFDRISANYTFNSLTATETFTGSGSRTRFELAWPIDVIKTKTTISDSNGEILGTDYEVVNEIDKSYSYTRYKGVLLFNTAPANLSKVVIEYHKNISLLDAADRINYFYNPVAGQLGSDLGQLMQGVDYGGVEITGIGFDIGSGWDALPWFTTGYDQFDPDFTDQLIKSDGVSRSFTLGYAPTEIEYINVYWNGSRKYTTATPLGTGEVDSTSLIVSNASGIKKGQEVTGVGVQFKTVVSDISGATVTLTKALVTDASGVYTFKTTETFNRRLDDPNYLVVKPLLEKLTVLKNEQATLIQNLSTAQEDKDFNIVLLDELTRQLDVLFDSRAVAQVALDQADIALDAAILTGNAQTIADAQAFKDAKQQQYDDIDDEYVTTQQAAISSLNARDAAITLLLTGNNQLATYEGTSPILNVEIFDVFGRLIISSGTYSVGQSIVITGTLSDGEIDGYVSGKTYYIGEIINNTSVRLTSTYAKALATGNNRFDVSTTPGNITSVGATVEIKGKINTVQQEISNFPSIVNTSAIMNSFVGNGVSTGPIVIPNNTAFITAFGSDIADQDNIILRKNTSDGSFKPSDIQYDTQLFGGDFAYVSATGLAAEDINVDGDGFVTPTSSYAPEEVVTGQVVDTVDITVYHKIGDGAPVIESNRYLIAGDIGFSYTSPSNGPGGTTVQTNSLTVGLPNPNWASAIIANPSNYRLSFNGGPSNVAISSISGPQGGTNVYTLTGTWPANPTGFPIIIASNNYAPSSNAYDIGQRPGTSSSVIVKVNGNIIRQDVDYSVNSTTNQIELITSYPVDSEIVITSLSQNGLNILDLDYFVGDGTTDEFVSVARWATEATAFVTIDGEAVDVVVFKTDSQYTLVGTIGIRFNEPPADGAIINYTILGSAVDSISKVQKQTIVYNGVDTIYDLTTDPEFIKPLATNVLVVANGELLRPTDTFYFTVAGASRTYTIDSSRYAFNTVDSKTVTVSVNGINIVQAVDYFWIPVNNQLKVKKGVAKTGDTISLSIVANSDYNIISTDTGTAIEFYQSYSTGTVIRVVTFSNHDILEIEREHDTMSSASTLIPGVREYYKFNQLVGGRIKLRRPAIASQYVWITLNKKLLTPDIDYALENNLNYVSFKPTIVFADTDIIDVIAFSNKVTRSSFGYKIFKDMLNKNTYFRIDDSSSSILAKTLNYYDNTIELVDATNLPEPSAVLNKPGVIFIDKERIEYFKKDGNILKQIKRGTLGTGVKDAHPIESLVRDQSIVQTVPYKDEFITSVTVSDGFSIGSTIYTNSPEVKITSVIFPGEDQTADVSGQQIVQVIGLGFKINVRVFVGDVECVVTRLGDTKLTFVTPSKSVGAYDLIIYNPPITSPTTVVSGNYSGTVTYNQNTSTALTTKVTLTSGTTSNLRVGLTLNKISGVGNFGGITVIVEINNSTEFTIKTTTPYVQGNIVFTATSQVVTITVPGTVTTAGLSSIVTLSASYVDSVTKQSTRYTTDGFRVGQIISKVSGTGNFGTLAIITEINSLTTFTVTAISNNTSGPVVFNINNQTPTSRVVAGGIKYLTIPLDFKLTKPVVNTTWYRKSIPSTHNQCNDVEVFVAGRRLRKDAYTIWNPTLGPDSPSGDVAYEAEFSVTSTNNQQPMQIRLTEVPGAGQYIVVQKRVGRTWTTNGVGLADSGSDPAKFIRATYALLPDKNKV